MNRHVIKFSVPFNSQEENNIKFTGQLARSIGEKGGGAGGLPLPFFLAADIFLKFTYKEVNRDGVPPSLFWEHEKKIEVKVRKLKLKVQDPPPPPYGIGL